LVKLAAPGANFGFMRASEPDAPEQDEEPPPPPEERDPAPEDPHPLAVKPPVPPARVEPVVVPRWIQLVMLPLAVLGLWGLIRASGPVFLLFVIAGLIALLLNPFATLLRRAGFPRGAAVATVFLSLVLALGGIGLLIANPVADQVSSFRDNVPEIVDDANATLADVQSWLDRNGIDVQVSEPGKSALDSLGESVAEGSGELVAFTRDALVRLVEASLAVILIVVLSVYMLLYGERIGAIVRGIVPQGDGTPEDDYPTRVQSAVFGYVRGQLLFSLIMGTSAGVCLWILGSLGIFPEGRTYALFFGAFYGFAELIPYIGPAIGAGPPVLIALFGGEPLDALWLTIMFTALQQIEGHIVAPNVFGHALRINPLLVILALLLGGQLYGFIGAFISLPIAAVLRETTVYLRRHLVLEPWPTAPAVALARVTSEAPRCPECGAPVAPGAERCTACGTELGDPDEAAAATSAAPS
jgi:predicted PurR-regulated permease PerM